MIAPQLLVTADRIHGCTPWLVRLLSLFSFGRCVTVDRRRQHVIITMQVLWWRRTRVVPREGILRIAYRAQAIPVFAPWRYLSLEESGHSDSALFFICLELTDRSELPLFTVWERQPRDPDWLDRLAGMPVSAPRIGDEEAGRIVGLLQEYLGLTEASTRSRAGTIAR